jgi:hypothetical protein
VQVTPYGWLPWIQGNVEIKRRTTGIDIDPIQVLGHLERMPWMSYIEARRGPLSFYNDVFYANVGVSGSGIKARDFGRIGASASLDFEEVVAEFGATYQIMRLAPHTAVDVLAGARYWHQDMSVAVNVAGAVNIDGFQIFGGRAVDRSGSIDWADPLIGLRLRAQCAPGQEIILRGDIGGFDAGSHFSWNVLAAYTYDFLVQDGVKYSGMLGYRLLDANYSTGEGSTKYSYDVLMQGPVLGLTVSF